MNIIKAYFTEIATTDFCNQYLEMLAQIFPDDKIVGIPASNFLLTQHHDEYKNQWCKENNIPLIRISYTQLKNLTIKDLSL